MSKPQTPDIFRNTGELGTVYDVRFLAEMGETQAQALKDVAKNTYAIPARQETVRLGVLAALVAFMFWQLLPIFVASKPSATTIAIVMVASLAIVGVKPAIDSLVKYLQGS